MSNAAIEKLYSYWNSLREDGQVPARKRVNPRAVPEVLDSTFIIELVSPYDYRFRVAGLQICEMAGMEVRGLSPEVLVAKPHKHRLSAIIAEVAARPTVARLEIETVDSSGNRSETQMILMPLRGEYQEITRVLGCLPLAPEVSTPPVTILLRGIDLQSVDYFQQPETEYAGFAEDRTSFLQDGAHLFRSIQGGGQRRATGAKPAREFLRVVD